MRYTLIGSFALVLTLAGLASGDDANTPAAILEKALQAAGGEAKLAKLQGLTLKGKGVYHEPGKPDLPFSGVWYYQGADKGRTLIQIEAKGGKSEELRVINGDKGWIKEGKLDAQQMDKDELAEEKEGLYFNWVTTLAPLKGKDFKLGPLDEAKVDGKAAVGFSITRKGHENINLYFDKETGLLVKSERKVKDGGTKKLVNEETLFSNFKEVDGVKIPLKFSVKWNGQPQAAAEMSEAKLVEKLDDKLFAKP